MHTERDSINGTVSVISHETARSVPDTHTHTHINIVLGTAHCASIRFMGRDCVSLVLNVACASVCYYKGRRKCRESEEEEEERDALMEDQSSLGSHLLFSYSV